MTIIFLKKIIILSFLFFSFNIVNAQLVDTGTVGVNARVGEDIVVTPGGGAGSSGSIALPNTAVRFSGLAYPNATVTLLKQGEIKNVVKASTSGEFTITLEENYDSNIIYSLYAEDVSLNRSLLINYPIVVKVGFITHLSGIRFAPTISVDKKEVKFGNYLTVNGYALGGKDLELVVEGIFDKTFTLTSAVDGSYKMVVPLGSLSKGDYTIFARYAGDTRVSKLVKFTISNVDVLNSDEFASLPGDCNVDHVINLVDFSVLAFWYNKTNPPVCVDTNHDNIINLTDFSILAFYWTG